MDYDAVRARCLRLPGAFEDFPFGPGHAVFKVRGRPAGAARMFALLWEDDGGARINLKCEPVLSEQLRAAHAWIAPAYHMDKRHWVTVDCAAVPDAGTLADLVEDSWDLVVEGLPAADRDALGWRRLAGG